MNLDCVVSLRPELRPRGSVERSDRVRRDSLKGHSAGSIVEANLKLVEDSGASEKVETDSKALRKTNGSSDLRGPDLDWEVMDKSRNKTSIADYDHLRPTALPVMPMSLASAAFTMLKVAPESTKTQTL